MSKHEQAESLFKNKLSQIASCSLIDERDFEKLLYGCKDVIPDGDRERITSISSLFQELKKRGKLNVDNREFLVDLLNIIGHKKLADELLEILTWERIEKLKNQGRVAFKEQKFCKARDVYCEALQLIPPSYSQNSVAAKEWQTLTLKWARCLIQLGNVKSDHSYFKQAYDVCVNELLKQDPEDLRAKFLLAESLDGLEQYDDAYKELKILLKVKPMNPYVLFLYKKVEKIKFELQDEPRSAIPQQHTSSSGDAYPRKILLVCDKWSGWHLSLYAANRHLCQSFGKQKGVQVACLVLDATEADTCKALRNNIHLIKAASKSGVLAGDKRLLFMHDCFPFDEPDLVIGHGMITGVEAAELARKFKCKYLQILYDPPEECTNSDESRSKEEAEKQAELGRDADFVAAIGPLLALEWSNTLNRNVMELIHGIPHVTERNSIPTPNNRCLILKTDEARQVGLDLVIQALNDCKRRSRPVNINIQSTPRSKKDELQSFLENKLWRSKFDVRVTSHDASIESVRGEISAVSLMIMPEQSHAFGVRGLEAIGAGVPILISNTYGLAHILLKYFDEKFWKFVCPTDEEDDYESWSERIDAFFDDRDEYFRLALELREEWNKMFSWDTSVIHIFNDLAMSGCFEKVATQDAINEKLQIPLYSKEALEFVKKELQLDEKRRKHILIVSPTKCQEAVSSVSNLSKVPWISVFDFDVNSAKTGFLACCEKLANEMGMKICRIVSPEPGERKRKVILPNGVPWILLEGKPECKRNMNECLDWLRSILASIESSCQAPITILVLWNSCEENRGLTKKLAKFLVLIESLNLKERIKLSIVTTNDDKSSILKDIEEDWGITARSFSLSDVGYAINDIVSERPLACESLDFTLPVATPDGSVSVEVLPLESRWVNAELEVLYQTVGDTPEHGSEDANHFYRGGTISWYALNSGYAIERESWEPIKSKIDELLTTAGTLRQTLPHGRGTGGTTSARKIIFDYHKSYPCVNVKSINLSETAPAIKVLAEFCKRPVLVLIDCKNIQGQEFELEMLYNNLSNSRVPCILLEIVRQVSNGRKELRAAENLSNGEADNFVQIYSNLRKEKTSFLNKLRKDENEELQIPFYYALVTFEEQFLGLEPFVEDCINGSNKQQRQVLIFLALAHHYGHTTISKATLTQYLNAPIGITLLEDVLTKESMQLLIEEDGEWRPRHDLIGSKMLEKLLTYQEPDSPVRIHNDYWMQRVADEAITFIDVMPETLVSGLLLTRISSNEKHSNVFSPLINDIPDEDDAIRVFEKAIDLFPDNMFFKVHLGRFYSITKKAAGFSMAIQYTDKGIACADSDSHTSRVVRSQFAQMKGVVFSRQVNYLKNDRAKINEVIKFAEKGVKWFRRAVSICPDMVDAYIPEVNMMCKLFEYIDKETGSVHEYLQQPNCHPFIVDGISQTLDTLECVPDCDNYSVWKVRILNLGLRKSRRRMEETLVLLEQLRNGKRASIGVVNRHIVSTKIEICRQHKRSLASIAHEVMDLLNEALACDKDGMERTMCIWVKIAGVVPVSLQEAESRIFKWCTKMKSLRSYLYQYIIAFINVLDKGRRDHVDLLSSTYHELNNTIKAISRRDIGIVQHPVKAVVWLGKKSNHMDQLVYLNVPSSASTQRRTVLPIEYTTKLRRFTGTITSTDPKLGTISVDGLPNKIKFRTDLCDPQLTSATFANRKVEFFLCFNFFGVNPYNVRVIDE